MSGMRGVPGTSEVAACRRLSVWRVVSYGPFQPLGEVCGWRGWGGQRLQGLADRSTFEGEMKLPET